MWIFDAKGKKTEATIENAKGMLSDKGGFSALWPKGTPAAEKAEFERLVKTDEANSPVEPTPEQARVHAKRRAAGEKLLKENEAKAAAAREKIAKGEAQVAAADGGDPSEVHVARRNATPEK
jgi:hypothetical protein